jgi:hypothetical protein
MTPASSIGARVTLSRFRAPRVTSRNRSGRADAETEFQVGLRRFSLVRGAAA